MAKITKVTVTPEIAGEMLSRNYEGNRSIRKSYVSQLAHAMESGNFDSDNGQTIVVGTDGTLYDGQHRLNAVIKSGKTFDFYVFTVDGDGAYKTIDNGVKRKAKDYIDAPNAGDVAALARVAACIEYGSAALSTSLYGKMDNITPVDRPTIVEYADNNADVLGSIVRNSLNMRRACGCCARSVFSAFQFVVKFCERDILLDEFVSDFSNQVPENSTVLAARLAIQKAFIKHVTPTKIWLVGLLLDAYEHYMKHDGSTMLNSAMKRIDLYSRYIETQRAMRGDAR